MRLVVEGLSCGYGNRLVLEDITFSLEERKILCLLGPNGTGKSTLIQCLDRLMPVHSGQIFLDGRNFLAMSRRDFSKRIAYIPQAHTPVFPFLVEDVVAMGRTPHLGLFSAPGKKDRKQVAAKLEQLGIAHLAKNPYTELSGGERQMVLFASAVVQEPDLLLLDEPTSHLDFGNQVRVLEVIRTLAGNGMSVVMATHSPEHAFLCADYVAVMNRGRIGVWGEPKDALTEHNIRGAYGVDVRVVPLNEEGGEYACVPLLPKTTV